MHTTLRAFIIFFFGLLGGLGLSVLLLFYLFRTDGGQALIRSYIISQDKWPDVQVVLPQGVTVAAGTTTSSSVAQRILNTQVYVAVPKAFATAEYAAAIDAVMSDLQALGTSTNELGPLLIQMNTQSLSGNFTGFFDLVVKTKVLVALQKGISSRFAQDLTALSVVNQQTPDAVTKSMTQALVAAGAPVRPDLVSFTGALDQLLSGTPPTAQLIANLSAVSQTLGKDMFNFNGALSPLLKHFSDYVANSQAPKKQ